MNRDNKEKRRAGKREEILAAARKILEKDGFEDLNMRRLALDLAINPATLYFYFANKEALVRELCDELYAAMAKGQQRFLTVKDPVERLKRICGSYVDFSRQDPTLFRLMFMDPVSQHLDTEPGLKKGNQSEDAYGNFLDAVRETLRVYRRDPSPAEVRRFAQVVWSLGHGAACLATAFSDDAWFRIGNPRRIFEEGLELVLEGLKKGDKR